MIGILALLGFGLAMTAIGGFGDDDDDNNAEASDSAAPPPDLAPPPPGTDLVELIEGEDDVVVAEEDRSDITGLLTEFSEQTGELTPEELDAELAALDFVDGPINVATHGGADVIFGSGSDDVIDAGADNDLVVGGAGDDVVQLGEGNDLYGFAGTGFAADVDLIDEADAPDDVADYISELVTSDAGDDSIYGGAGNDDIVDMRGENHLAGNEGNDTLVALDRDGLTPDFLTGGSGADDLIVDEGDVVWGNHGSDLMVVDLPDELEEGYQPVKIADYEPGQDIIVLEDVLDSLSHVHPDLLPDTLVTVEDLADGTGAMVSVNGIPVIEVIGGQGLNAADIFIA